MSPHELIAEFHAVSGVKPGNVTYEHGLIVFRYPKSGLPQDSLSLQRFAKLIEAERNTQSAWILCRKIDREDATDDD